MPKVIKVSDNFWKILEEGHKNLNSVLYRTTKKKTTFIDYTDILAMTIGEDLRQANKNIILPIPKGRSKIKLKKLRFEF